MPVYEYQCEQCGEEFELIQRITAPPGGTCPGCGSTRVHRLISLTSFQLKGSGWYVTDYGGKKNGANGTVKSDSASKPAEATKSDTGSKDPASSSSTSESSAEKTSSSGDRSARATVPVA